MATRVLIVHNALVLAEVDAAAIAERCVLDTVVSVSRPLRQAGFDVGSHAIGRQLPRSLARVARWQPDVIFNLFEGWGDDPASEACVTRALESLHVPITGSPAHSLELTGAKQRAKLVLVAEGLPTPQSLTLEAAPLDLVPLDLSSLNWPLIVKPALYHASLGIEQASVVTTAAQLSDRVAHLQARYRGPLLIEEFIVGREFTVGVVEHPRFESLPAMEFEFHDGHLDKGRLGNEASGDFRMGDWPLLTYEAKWCPASRAYQTTPARHGVLLPLAMQQGLEELACLAFRCLGCREYARVDFRVDASGRPWILEVNANPDLSPTACLTGALAAAGRDYGGFVVALVEMALNRNQGQKRTSPLAVR